MIATNTAITTEFVTIAVDSETPSVDALRQLLPPDLGWTWERDAPLASWTASHTGGCWFHLYDTHQMIMTPADAFEIATTIRAAAATGQATGQAVLEHVDRDDDPWMAPGRGLTWHWRLGIGGAA